MTKFYSCQIGQKARRMLMPGVCGQLLAGFSGSAYLVTEQSELFWLASENAPMHLRGLRIKGPFPKLLAGEEFFIEGQCIRIASDKKVDFCDASTWTAAGIPTDTVPEIATMPLRVKSIFGDRLYLKRARGFGRLIPNLFPLASGQPNGIDEMAPVLAHAWPCIHDIAQACLLGDIPCLLQKSAAMVGLGEGLTPSGDDFLGGLLFCVNTLQRLYPGFIELDSSELVSLLGSAEKRTHPISFAILKDLAAGRAVEPLHELIRSIFTDRPLECIRPISRLTRIGHSTGWDLLTGMLTGLLLTFRGQDSMDSSAVTFTK